MVEVMPTSSQHLLQHRRCESPVRSHTVRSVHDDAHHGDMSITSHTQTTRSLHMHFPHLNIDQQQPYNGFNVHRKLDHAMKTNTHRHRLEIEIPLLEPNVRTPSLRYTRASHDGVSRPATTAHVGNPRWTHVAQSDESAGVLRCATAPNGGAGGVGRSGRLAKVHANAPSVTPSRAWQKPNGSKLTSDGHIQCKINVLQLRFTTPTDNINMDKFRERVVRFNRIQSIENPKIDILVPQLFNRTNEDLDFDGTCGYTVVHGQLVKLDNVSISQIQKENTEVQHITLDNQYHDNQSKFSNAVGDILEAMEADCGGFDLQTIKTLEMSQDGADDVLGEPGNRCYTAHTDKGMRGLSEARVSTRESSNTMVEQSKIVDSPMDTSSVAEALGRKVGAMYTPSGESGDTSSNNDTVPQDINSNGVSKRKDQLTKSVFVQNEIKMNHTELNDVQNKTLLSVPNARHNRVLASAPTTLGHNTQMYQKDDQTAPCISRHVESLPPTISRHMESLLPTISRHMESLPPTISSDVARHDSGEAEFTTHDYNRLLTSTTTMPRKAKVAHNYSAPPGHNTPPAAPNVAVQSTEAIPVDSATDTFTQMSNERRLKQLEPPVMFNEYPESRPLTVCFDYTGTKVSHKDVYRCIMDTIEHVVDARVVSLQFGARNVMLGTMWVDNRWTVTVSTKQCVNVLLGRGITLAKQPVKLKRYDDIVKDEYAKFHQYIEKVKKKSSKTKIDTSEVPAQHKPHTTSLLEQSEQGHVHVESVMSQLEAKHTFE